MAEVRGLVERALRAHGADEHEAAIFADVLIEAELRGRSTHGLNRLGGLLTMLRTRRRDAPQIVMERGPLAAIDGRDQSGYVVGVLVADTAVRLAGREGLALVGARNTRHAGMLGYYVGRAAQQGVIALLFADCSPLVAPWGGAESVLGTNPIAAAFPNEPYPILIDLGTSATTYGALDQARRSGERAPEQSALDASGRPTTDPAAVHAILPLAGHKGYALALMVQLLSGVVVGAAAVPPAHQDYGMMMLAVRPDVFAPPERYRQGVAEVVRRIKSARRMSGVEEILIPGERAFRERESRLREGIELSDQQWTDLQALAAR
jgi:LDH2 family malate/lactate/ureidoglycolate dehydrogenase